MFITKKQGQANGLVDGGLELIPNQMADWYSTNSDNPLLTHGDGGLNTGGGYNAGKNGPIIVTGKPLRQLLQESGLGPNGNVALQKQVQQELQQKAGPTVSKPGAIAILILASIAGYFLTKPKK